MDLRQRTVVEGVTPLPAELHMLIARMQQVPCLRNFQPNEANAIDYRQDLGHWLKPHVDDRCVIILLLWGVGWHVCCIAAVLMLCARLPQGAFCKSWQSDSLAGTIEAELPH